MSGILALDKCWLVTIKKKTTLNIILELFEEKLHSTWADGKIIQDTTIIKKIKDVHKAKMEKYWRILLDFDDKYSRVYATIELKFENHSRVYIKSVADSNKIRNGLNRWYKVSDLATKNNT